MANPRKELDWGVLDALLKFKISLAFCADHMKIGKETIVRRIREKHDMTFGEYHALKMEGTGTKLQQKAIEMALKGNATMLIFSLKNIAKWADKVDESVVQKLEINIDKDDAAV